MALAPRMQAITLDVIMRGIFGVDDPQKGTPEYGLRQATRRLTELSTKPVAHIGELTNLGREEPVGLTKLAMTGDRQADVPGDRRQPPRQQPGRARRHNVAPAAGHARGRRGASDQELRDELLTLALAGHETAANQLAWACERRCARPTPTSA